MKVAQDQEGNKAKLYSEIVVKEAPKPRTIGAKIHNEVIVKETKINAKLYLKIIVKKSPKIKDNRRESIQ